jgi:hypothetical protein
MRLFKCFLRRDEGLVTIEWVGIAAVMVIAAIGISTYIMEGADGTGGAIDTKLDGISGSVTASTASAPPVINGSN